MGEFRTKLDTSNNRQIKQREGTSTLYSGSTTFGLPFSALTSGPADTSVTDILTGITSTFSGNTGTTVWTFGDARMSIAESALDPITPLNSGTTQFTDDVFVAATSTVIDGNTVNLTYTGVAFNIQVTGMTSLGGGAYSGSAITNNIEIADALNGLEILSAETLDYTGRTIWIDSPEIIRTKKLIVTDGATSGYVLKSDAEGMATWQPDATGATVTTPWSAGTGTNSANLDGSDNTVSGDYAIGIGTGNTVSGKNSMAIGRSNNVIGDNSLAVGKLNTINSAVGGLPSFDADGPWGIAIGINNTVSNAVAFAGGYASQATQAGCFAWGDTTTASAQDAFAVNDRTVASGYRSFATGRITTASGTDSSSFGRNTLATGIRSQVTGLYSVASGTTSIANGGYTIAGGQYSFVNGQYNYVFGASSSILGGGFNTLSTYYSIIGGGFNNTGATNDYISILGGDSNRSDGRFTIIGSGFNNIIDSTSSYSIIGNGLGHVINGAKSIILGGGYNKVYNNYATVIGGKNNINRGKYSLIGAGYDNFIGTGGTRTVIIGGDSNTGTTNSIFIGLGKNNYSSGAESFIGNGSGNMIYSQGGFIGSGNGHIINGLSSFIGSGGGNQIYASNSSIVGGGNNLISGTTGLTNVHIIGSNITGTTANTTYVENFHYNGRITSEIENSTIITTATTLDLSSSNIFNIDLTGSTELDYTNEVIGYYDILVTNQTTGSTLTFATGRWMAESGATPTITATSGATDILSCLYNGSKMIIKQTINDIQDI
jgi:hypothetical protein